MNKAKRFKESITWFDRYQREEEEISYKLDRVNANSFNDSNSYIHFQKIECLLIYDIKPYTSDILLSNWWNAFTYLRFRYIY